MKSSKNFWTQLKRPFFALAPMADVTDAAFRQMFVRHGKPDVMYTEMVSTDGLCSKGFEKLKRELIFLPNERPIIAQVWGTNPLRFCEAAEIIAAMGFDGIDINMGCPQLREVRLGGGAALIKTPNLAREIIRQTKLGAAGLPVSVKTRTGFDKPTLEKWLPELLAESPAVVTIHARTRKEMSRVPAKWEEVSKAVEIRDKLKSKTLIVGNGDIKSLEEAKKRAQETGCDGVMVARGVFGNPWFFDPERQSVTVSEKLEALEEHARLFEKIFGSRKNFVTLNKHFKAYASGFDGAKELRLKLMHAQHLKAVEEVISNYLKG